MRKITFVISALVLTLFAAGLVSAASAELVNATSTRHSRESGNPEVDPAAKARISENYGKLPLAFEVNNGQTDKQVDFLSRGAGYSLFLTPTEAVMVLQNAGANGIRETNANQYLTEELPQPLFIKEGGVPSSSRSNLRPSAKSADDVVSTSVLRMQLDGGNPSATVAGEETQPGTSNYFVGNDPEQWHTRVANYGKVRYQGVYDGVDLVYYGNQRKLEYDFIVQPGADYRQIRLRIQGADHVSIDADGNLVLHTEGGDVVQHAPIIYQADTDTGSGFQSPASRLPVSGRYILLADNQATGEENITDAPGLPVSRLPSPVPSGRWSDLKLKTTTHPNPSLSTRF